MVLGGDKYAPRTGAAWRVLRGEDVGILLQQLVGSRPRKDGRVQTAEHRELGPVQDDEPGRFTSVNKGSIVPIPADGRQHDPQRESMEARREGCCVPEERHHRLFSRPTPYVLRCLSLARALISRHIISRSDPILWHVRPFSKMLTYWTSSW